MKTRNPSLASVGNFAAPDSTGPGNMKMPQFVRNMQSAAPVRSPQMFDQRPSLPASVSSQDRPRGSVSMPDLKFASRLPDHAQKILTELAFEALESGETALSWDVRRGDRRDAIAHAKARISQFSDPLHRYGGGSDAAIAEQKAIIDECQAELAHVEARCASLGEKSRTANQLIEAARALVRMANAPIAPYSGTEPSLKKNEALTDAVEARRRRLRELSADFERVKVAPKLAADVKADAIAAISALAKRGTPDVFNAIETGGEIIWPTTQMYLPDGMMATTFDALGFDCWVRKDAIIAGIEREIDLMADDENAMSDIDREKLLQQIARDTLATEREEVHFVRLANQQGIVTLYRGETNPVALLGLAA